MRIQFLSVTGLLLLFCALSKEASGTMLESVTTGTSGSSASAGQGQSITTPVGGPYDDITFNFYSSPGVAAAPGTLFILTTAPTGSASSLSTSTAGFLAESTSTSGGVYQFNPSVILQGGAQYYFISNVGSTLLGAFGSGLQYYDNGSGFQSETATLNFTLNGNAVSVPEPSTAMLLLPIVPIGALWFWKRAKNAVT